jgi:pimeloyl-ACP methyl ester carboxylesterase
VWLEAFSNWNVSPPDLGSTGAVRLRDGRTIAYAEWGDPRGSPVIYFQGAPSCRLHHPDAAISRRLGARVITIDRPGFGRSDPKPQRTLLDWPDDVAELADTLRIERFALVGISAGGPYVAACAYKIPDRLTNVVIAGGGGPLDAPDATHGMARERRWGAVLIRRAPWLLAAVIWLLRHPGRNPQRFFERFTRELAPCDREVIDQPEIRRMLIECYAESAHQGVRGFLTELRVLSSPWGFRLEDIRVNVTLWHGAQDTSTPVSMARYMASAIPRCGLKVLPDEGHFLLFNHWEEILRRLLPGQRAISPGRAPSVPRTS